MCGFAGIFDVQGTREIERGVLLRMNESQFHRGPDEGGLHIEAGLGLAHRRLSIIDRAGGGQPLATREGDVVVVFNGEIYNHRELARELKAAGHRFETRCDTEVILHGWRAWGPQCVTRFNGMFAFALWDRAAQTLFLARDRLGVKPLHYSWLPDGQFIFGSELKALKAHGAMPRVLDPLALEEYFALGYVPDPRTIFSAAKKLPPAHTLLLRRGSPPYTPLRYWDVDFAPRRDIGFGPARDELAERLVGAVGLRMEAEVPLGAFLSGGVDSSAVVAAMSAVRGEPVTTCSIGFVEAAFDESAYARQVADTFHTRHVSERVRCTELDLIDTLAQCFDEPFADSSALPTYRVCALARAHVTVALSGDGADESFAGYARYRRHAKLAGVRDLAPALWRVLGAAAQALPRGRRTLQALAQDTVSAYFEEVSVVRRAARSRLFSHELTRELGGYNALQVFRDHAARAGTHEPLALMQYLDLHTYLPGDINTKVDRTSMAHALEVREPMMDHTLVEWLAALPGEFKLHRGQSKWLLKQALAGVLPHAVMHRPKMGFALPIAQWLRGPAQEPLREAVLGPRLAQSGWFEPGALATLVDEHRTGRHDHAAALWALMMFEAFLRQEAA